MNASARPSQVVKVLGGCESSQARALSARENGSKSIMIFSPDTWLIFNVAHFSKNCTIWDLAHSEGVPLYWVEAMNWMKLVFNSELLGAIPPASMALE